MISLHNKLFFLGILVIFLSGCNQPIQLEKHSDAYLIKSSEKPIHLWTYPGARNFSNVYTSYPLPNTPLLEVTINEPIEVDPNLKPSSFLQVISWPFLHQTCCSACHGPTLWK